MARTFSRPSQAYPPNTYGPFTIDNLGQADEGFELRLTREAWPTGLVVTIIVEFTADGLSWFEWIRQEFEGGTHLDHQGNVLVEDILSCTWPGENDGTGGRRKLRKSAVRFTAIVVQTFTTAITLGPI